MCYTLHTSHIVPKSQKPIASAIYALSILNNNLQLLYVYFVLVFVSIPIIRSRRRTKKKK